MTDSQGVGWMSNNYMNYGIDCKWWYMAGGRTKIASD